MVEKATNEQAKFFEGYSTGRKAALAEKSINSPTLLPVRPGTISDNDRAALREAGVIVIEHETPEELRLIQPGVEIEAGTMLTCALKALAFDAGQHSENRGTLQRSMFTKLLAEKISR